MSRMLTLLAAGMALLAVVAPSASAQPRNSHSDQRAIRIMSSIAAHQVHAYSGDKLPIGQLESDVAAGQRILVSCGTVSQVGVDAARRAGFEAREVGAFTRQPLNHYDDGHIMVEVRLSEGWTVFDLDNNRMAPPGVGITQIVRDPRWRMIAHDPAYDVAETEADPDPAYDIYMFTHMNVWYRRVLGVPTVWGADGTVWFHDGAERERGLSMGYQWASGRYWSKLNS